MRSNSRPIAFDEYDLADSDRKMSIRVYVPTLEPDGERWACRYTIDAPLSVDERGFGGDSLVALVEALRGLSRAIYGSAAYGNRLIGVEGVFDGELFIPATSDMLEIAPFPF